MQPLSACGKASAPQRPGLFHVDDLKIDKGQRDGIAVGGARGMVKQTSRLCPSCGKYQLKHLVPVSPAHRMPGFYTCQFCGVSLGEPKQHRSSPSGPAPR
jgi:hypothetical protein